MDFPVLAPRTEPTALSSAILQRPTPAQISTRAETARPVVAANAADTTRSTQQEFQPLDIYKVGDNDRMPVPPEPPRKSAVLAVIATAPPVEEVEDPVPAPEPITTALRETEEGPANPTVDVRS